ncbi:MAG: uncharacterized protein V7632_5405, partial [Bradyrhizobium sp.]
MSTDDLNAPLGQLKTEKRRLFPVAIAPLIAAALALCTAVFVGWALLANDPLGGEPVVVVAANPSDSGEASRAAKPGGAGNEHYSRHDGAAGTGAEPPAAPADRKTVTIIDGSSGKRSEVVVANAADGKSGQRDERVIETSRHGPLPKIAADGAKPSEVFAQPIKA